MSRIDSTQQEREEPRGTEADAPGPLTGIRVLDFSSIMAGPVCTRLLADMGAEVIKVETPEGDHGRTRYPFSNGHSIHFAHLNCGKKSVCLDLKSEEGKQAALALARVSDIVVENWRPGVSARLGLDYDTLRALRPDIIYCAISGYGQTGPNAKLPAFASLVEAMSGFALSQMRLDGTSRPQNSGLMLGDSLSGLWAFAGIQTALVQRLRTGKGAMVDLSMHDSLLHNLVYEFHEAQFGISPRRTHVPHPTKDGFIHIPPVTERTFQDVADVMGRPELTADPRFNTRDAIIQNWYELLGIISEWTKEHTTAECEQLLAAKGAPYGRFRSVAEVLEDPHTIARGSITTIEFDGVAYSLPNAAFQISGANTRAKSKVAKLNEDADDVLGGILGYSPDQIAACAGSTPRGGH